MTSSSKKIRTVCQGFHKEPTPERPTASVDPVWRPAALRPHRFRALVIFAAFTSRRWSELVALACKMLILTPEWCTLCESSLNCRTANGFGQAEVRGRFPHSGLALSVGGGGSRAPSRVPHQRSGGPDLQRAEGGGVTAKQLPSIGALGRMRGQGRAPSGLPVPRSAPHRKHVGGLVGGEHTGADASDGAREYARCIDLSACHEQPGSGDCGCD